MEVTSQHMTGLPNETIKLEEDLCGLNQQESETFPGTSAGLPDMIVKLEPEEDLCSMSRGELETFAGSFTAPPAPPSRPRKSGRGIAWTHRETLDLIALWGEEEVQEQLRECHRNIDLFERIAADMQQKGHDRTAEECRTKSKALRQRYREVVNHNGRSKNGGATMPFFQELHNILGGDTSVHPKRVPRNTNIQRVTVGQGPAVVHILPAPATPVAPTPEPNCQDHFKVEERSEMQEGQDKGTTILTLFPVEEEAEASLESSAPPQTTEITDDGVVESDYELMWGSRNSGNVAALDNPKAAMTPGERLAQHKRRKERKAAVDISEKMLLHSTTQMNRLLAHLKREGSQFLEFRQRQEDRREAREQRKEERMERMEERWQREEKRVRVEDELARRDRERLTASIERQTSLLETLVLHLTSQGATFGGGPLQRRLKEKNTQGQPSPSIVDSQEDPEEVLGTSASLLSASQVAVPGKARPCRKIKRPDPLSL